MWLRVAEKKLVKDKADLTEGMTGETTEGVVATEEAVETVVAEEEIDLKINRFEDLKMMRPFNRHITKSQNYQIKKDVTTKKN